MLSEARILIVDDEVANVDLLESLLLDEGYTNLERACDAREVMDRVAAAPPDLVLLDLHMPHLDGFELMRRLVASTPAGDFLPILVLTADITPETKQRALAGGAKDFLTKPIDAVEVGLRIRNLLETRLLHVEQARARAAAERSERSARVLAEASRALAASFDYATSLGGLARALVPGLADVCVVALEADGALEPLGIAHADPAAEVVLRESARALIADPDGAVRTHGEAVGIRSATAVPLRASSPLGTLLLGWRDERAAADDATIADVAARTALAVENARLFEQARQATQARDEMLGVVAHDLRNPLNTISLATQLLLEQLSAEQQPLERRQVEIIGRAVAGMNRLIQDLLDVKRIEHGGLALEASPIDLASVVRDSLELMRPLATARRLALEASLEPVDPVRADPLRVQQVISNLVGNAIKFTPPGGRVTVELAPSGDEVAIRVTDTGTGIAAEEIPHIFSRFWQGRRGDHRGIGLGLAIARGIVEAHGGRIWVESRQGHGSVFVVTLPAGTHAVREDCRQDAWMATVAG